MSGDFQRVGAVNRGSSILPAVLGMLLVACGAPPEHARAPAAARVRAAGQVDSTVIRWMECDDCRAGELDSVVALGEAAVPSWRAF